LFEFEICSNFKNIFKTEKKKSEKGKMEKLKKEKSNRKPSKPEKRFEKTEPYGPRAAHSRTMAGVNPRHSWTENRFFRDFTFISLAGQWAIAVGSTCAVVQHLCFSVFFSFEMT
jgi:ATPase subunit of ABC transporter with duplicated ATPase domains